MKKKTALNKAIQNEKNKTKTKSKTKGKLNPGLQAFLNKKKKMVKNKNIARGCGAVMRRKETFYA